jgi:hypothetical protein
MNKILSLFLVSSLGCGAILNGGTSRVSGPPGSFMDGAPLPQLVSKKSSHQVVMPNGLECTLGSSVSAGYLIADLIFTSLLGIVVDAVTGDWSTLDSDSCPGLSVE